MTRTVLTLLTLTLAGSGFNVHADEARPSPAQRAIASAAQQDQTAFILFYRSGDAATRNMHGVLKEVVSQRKDAAIVPVQIGSAAERALVERFDASRTPMPAVVALAPNGAVTGVFPQRVAAQQLTAAVASPGQATCLKALQDRKIVLLCVHPEGQRIVPDGVRQFQADKLYKNRTQVVHVQADDPDEARFLKQLRLRTDQPAPVVAFMAPPGVMLGTYDANVTHAVLARKLAAAGKCCDDANCKHHHAPGNNRSSRR